MTGMSSMSPFTGSGFRSGKARSSERRCWDCRKPMDTTTRLVRCGHCHDRRMATIAERRAASDVTPLVDDRVVNEVCDNCGSPLVVVRSRAGRFCTSECAEAFELS